MTDQGITIASAANTIARFLAHEEIRTADDIRDVYKSSFEQDSMEPFGANVVVLCASALLSMPEIVFSTLKECERSRDRDEKSSPTILVLCGGIGHSTQLLYEAVARHPRYQGLAAEIRGQPEARVLKSIAERFFGLTVHTGDPSSNSSVPLDSEQGFLILMEDESTNCGANASKTRELLDKHNIHARTIIVAQDPTMSRRTLASFEKVYSSQGSSRAPRLLGWPTLVPRVRAADGGKPEIPSSTVSYDIDHLDNLNTEDFWEMSRFFELIMGEIPRLRDDADGYGPRGKGFIAHVEVPDDVDTAWHSLNQLIGPTSRA